MTSGPPKVTVAMAVFNERNYIREAVDSILRQTLVDLELLVVDDGSTDGCIDELASIDDPRLIVHRQSNQGKATALNWVLDNARGDYIAIQDGDDTSYPQRLALQAAALDADGKLGAVFCRHDLIIENQRCYPRFRGADPEECDRRIQRGALPGIDPTIMFRREATAAIRFDPELTIGHGEDHLIAIGEKFGLLVIDGCHYSYRVHAENMSRQSRGDNARYAQMVADRASARRGRTAWRPDPSTDRTSSVVASYVVDSSVELVAVGRRREAVAGSLRFLRRNMRSASAWLALAYASSPGSILRRLRPDFGVMVDDRARYMAHERP